jgi:hypothetical protein
MSNSTFVSQNDSELLVEYHETEGKSIECCVDSPTFEQMARKKTVVLPTSQFSIQEEIAKYCEAGRNAKVFIN